MKPTEELTIIELAEIFEANVITVSVPVEITVNTKFFVNL